MAKKKSAIKKYVKVRPGSNVAKRAAEYDKIINQLFKPVKKGKK
jgi:hypothetical protein